jgi:methylated-DNA-[protein]-cysteine S-methyltransferase
MFYAFASAVQASWERGPVYVVATSRGVAAVELPGSTDAFDAGLRRRGLVVDPDRAGPDATRLAAEAAAMVLAMLAGDAVNLAAVPIDIDDRPAWDRIVLAAVRAIPRGATASYGEIARRIGRPGAARAVGGAVGRNPVGLLVPCHRVIAGDGSLGGYGVAAWGGREAALELKRELLALEGVEVRPVRVSGN